MKIVEILFVGLVALGVLKIVFGSQHSSQVISATTGGLSTLFGTVTSTMGTSPSAYPPGFSAN